MDELMKFIDEEFKVFAELYYGAPILDDLIEARRNIEIFLLKREQQIKDLYE